MPTFQQGNMWDVFGDVQHFIITTNSFLRNDGALVMGAGIARQVRDQYPGTDKAMGEAVHARCGHLGTYGLLVGWKLGMFQVKHHFKDQARLDLIQYSAEMLSQHATDHPDRLYALNYPGIGNGRLSITAVDPLLSVLPNNVQIWTFR